LFILVPSDVFLGQFIKRPSIRLASTKLARWQSLDRVYISLADTVLVQPDSCFKQYPVSQSIFLMSRGRKQMQCLLGLQFGLTHAMFQTANLIIIKLL